MLEGPTDRRPPGRVVATDDPRQPVALVGADGHRLTEYDGYLALRSRSLTPASVRCIAKSLLRWQRWQWDNPGAGDLRAELAEAVASAARTHGASFADTLNADVSGWLDFRDQRELVLALYLAPAAEFAALLARSRNRPDGQRRLPRHAASAWF